MMDKHSKETTKLVITGPEGTEQIAIEPKGATIGRDKSCDIVLDSNSVSRLHARIFRDPFGRWIIEDLESRNGVFIEGERIRVQAILPEQKVDIYPFTLSVLQQLERQAAPESPVQAAASVVDKGLEEEIVSYKADKDSILSVALIRCLNEITDRLLELNKPSELYSQASYHLATMLDAFAAFVRLPPGDDSVTKAPQVLASRFGRNAAKGAATQISNVHFSKRVLDAVRSTKTPVMARSGPSAEKQLVLTIVDKVNPHIVFSAAINDFDGTVDALYLDILENKCPKEMFDFIEAITRQISSVQKNLVASEAKAQRRILDRQLALAREIQSKLVPTELGKGFEVDVAVCYEPAMWVGGDYYDVWSLADGRIAFAVGDVSGKGLPAAMIMSNLQAALRTTMTFCAELSTVAQHINEHLCQSLRDDMFVTFFLGLFEPSTNKLSYVNAGHIPPLLLRPSAPVAQLLEREADLPLGIFSRPYEMATETLEPDARLLVVTDGITEAGSPDGQMFETERLSKLMTDSRTCSAQELVQSVIKAVADFRQTLPQQDDITIFALVNHKANPKRKS
jgi:serine phosphatase RsbU (regulator of sigma subunit)